ncbi:DUF2380 domain-containing protein [Methylophaga lonarensis]|uniref:DUF2380 domain-containing protein n=1 Tax=Methylophaga lonarensis TaxID=999151 RepID=UPI001F180C29|nr:DUF2380 domain-containing protein [Methylophaga lonarensis]
MAFTEVVTAEPQLPDTIVLHIELRGDDSLEHMRAHDQVMMKKTAEYLRQQLNQKTSLRVLSDEKSIAAISKAESIFNLQQCNGCELELARQLETRFVVVPWLFRMSILVQTMYIEVRDAEQDKVITHIGRNFRGNTDDAWQHAVDSLIRDLSLQYSPAEAL